MARILVIDDEQSIRETLEEILKFEGYEVETASNGKEGLELINNKGYDVILSDVKMPGIDGIELLEKSREIAADTPVVMISGHGNIELAVEAVRKGAYDFISKPPDLNRLLITLRNA